MSLKILGGLVKGQSLFVPKGQTIRPTSVMLRRKVFDANQNLQDYHFIDICAGSGAMGIESLSRGAESLISVEQNPKVYTFLTKNLDIVRQRFEQLQCAKKIQPYKLHAISWLKQYRIEYLAMSREFQIQTILFFDPPYEEKKLYTEFIELLFDQDNSWYRGQFWVESDRLKGFNDEALIQILKQYGDLKIYKHSNSFILTLKNFS